MEERHIKQKFDAGFIDGALVKRVRASSLAGMVGKFEVYFRDGKRIIPLETRRSGTRQFAELYSAVNVIEKIGIKKFTVQL